MSLHKTRRWIRTLRRRLRLSSTTRSQTQQSVPTAPGASTSGPANEASLGSEIPPSPQETADEQAAAKQERWVRRHWILTAAILAVVTTTVAALAGVPGWVVGRVKDALTDDVRVQVQTNQDKIQVNGRPANAQYVVPKLRADLAAPPTEVPDGSCLVTYRWATDQNGVVADVQLIQVHLAGQSGHTAHLNTVEIVQPSDQQKAPTSGSLPACGRGGGPFGIPILSVDLYRDPARSTWHFESADGKPIGFNLDLADKESQDFLVIATAHDCECHWSLNAIGVGQSEELKVPINDAGKSFAVTSEENADKVYRDGNQWKAPDPGAQIELLPPPPGIVLPTYDACSILNAAEWTAIASSPVTLSNHPLNSRWTSSQQVPGRPDQAVTNCAYGVGTSAILVQLILAATPADASTLATNLRIANQVAPWRQIGSGAAFNGVSSLVIQHGNQLIRVDVPGNRAAARWLPHAAQTYVQRLK